jgi:hypothetical protein
MEVSGQLHVPAALPSMPIGWRAGWAPRAGLDWRKEKSCLCRKSNPGRPARSPSLYRLSYPGSIVFPILLLFHLSYNDAFASGLCSEMSSICSFLRVKDQVWHSHDISRNLLVLACAFIFSSYSLGLSSHCLSGVMYNYVTLYTGSRFQTCLHLLIN